MAIALDEKTKIDAGGQPAELMELKPGQRVVVHTRKSDAGLVAVAIKMGKPGGARTNEAGAPGHDPGHEHGNAPPP